MTNDLKLRPQNTKRRQTTLILRTYKMPVRGRQIGIGEMRFVFQQIWRQSRVRNGDEGLDIQRVGEDDYDEDEVLIDAYYHVLDIVGTLINKAPHHDNDQIPHTLFLQFAKTGIV